MRLSDLNWFDVDSYLKNDNRIMVVVGSCEQHGYLSLMTDTKIPLAIADIASQRQNVLVAPPINFGASPYFLAYPGTISLRIATLMDVTEDVVRSLYRHGFKRILVLNGHGGNDPIKGRLFELANEFSSLRIRWYTWWNSHRVEEIILQNGLKPYHASWLEAFPFTRVSDLPEGEKVPPHVPGLLGSEESREIYGDGVFGGKYQVQDSIMKDILDATVEDVLTLLQFN